MNTIIGNLLDICVLGTLENTEQKSTEEGMLLRIKK